MKRRRQPHGSFKNPHRTPKPSPTVHLKTAEAAALQKTLRSGRHRLRLSQETFGKMIGCSSGCIQTYEYGKVDIPQWRLDEFHDAITEYVWDLRLFVDEVIAAATAAKRADLDLQERNLNGQD